MDVLLNGLSNIGFLTLAGMDPVVEGNHVNDSKRRQAYRSLVKFDLSLHFYFYECKHKYVHVLHRDIIAIKEDCCWLFFLKLSLIYSAFNQLK